MATIALWLMTLDDSLSNFNSIFEYFLVKLKVNQDFQTFSEINVKFELNKL